LFSLLATFGVKEIAIWWRSAIHLHFSSFDESAIWLTSKSVKILLFVLSSAVRMEAANIKRCRATARSRFRPIWGAAVLWVFIVKCSTLPVLRGAPWIKEALSRNLDEIIVAALVDRHTKESGVLVLVALARCLCLSLAPWKQLMLLRSWSREQRLQKN
jgi:hypothetical protein